MKIQPTPFVYRSLGRDGRAGPFPAGRPAMAGAGPISAASQQKDALRSRDAMIRRLAADPGFAVLSAAAYVAQQMGQILEAEEDVFSAETAAAYRRCEEAIGAILRPPMASAGITV